MVERRGAARKGPWGAGWATIAALVALTACGSTPAATTPENAPKAKVTGAQAKLQGTWEIVKYVSKEPIDPDAMPLIGMMFEDLRFKVADDQVVVDGKAMLFKAIDDDGTTFRLSTHDMFDKASCRFTSPDEFEVDDQGPTWPGKTVLHREN